MKFVVSLLALAGTIYADDIASHALLKIKPDGYKDLNTELKEFLESEQEKDKELTKHVNVQEVEGHGNASLVFISDKDAEMETLFVEYVPVSMVREIIKDKTWSDKKNEEL